MRYFWTRDELGFIIEDRKHPGVPAGRARTLQIANIMLAALNKVQKRYMIQKSRDLRCQGWGRTQVKDFFQTEYKDCFDEKELDQILEPE